MRNKTRQLSTLFIVSLSVSVANPLMAKDFQQDKTVLAVIGATLIDGTGASPIDNAVVLVREGQIECAGNRRKCPLNPETKTLDATGRWLVPGFIDSHIHWQVWYDSEKKLTLQTAARAARTYLANGITTVVDVGGQRWVNPTNRQVLDKLLASGKPAPRTLFSGWIDRKELDKSSSNDAGVVALELLSQDIAGIKIHNGLNKKDYERIVAVANQIGRPVYGHTYYMGQNGFMNFTSEAVAAGIDGIFHVLGIPPVTPEDAPPLPTAPLEDWQAWWLAGAKLWLHSNEKSMDELIKLMIKNDTWLQPTLITEQFQIQPNYYQDHPNWGYSPITREEIQLGLPSYEGEGIAQYQAAYAQMQKFVRRFNEAGGLIVAGTDGFPIAGFGLQEELRLLVEAGIQTLDAIQSATHNAAIAWRWQDRIGTLQQGKAADLVILAGDPLADITHTANIWRVIKAGVVYNPEVLLR